MRDPDRLLSRGATDFERVLLGAAARERPNSSQRRRMLRAIGLSQFSSLFVAAKVLASVAGNSVVLAVAAASLAGSASTVVEQEHSTNDRSTAVERKDTNTRAQDELARPEPQPVLADLPLEPARAAKVASGTKAPNGTHRPVDLREEIDLMDQARSALRSGAPSRALSTLEQYRARFPHGSFGQEAAVLRIEALEASGNHSRSVAEAKGFLARNPNSPHAERLRRIAAP